MEILAGAAAGQAFALLYQGVNLYVTKSLEFGPHLKQVGETLNSLEQLAIERGDVGLLEEERELAKFKTVWEKGKCLVEKLSKVHNMSMLKPIYNGQLDNLDKSLNRQLKILQALQAGGSREALVSAVVIENRAAVNRDEQVLLLNSVGDEVPKPPSNIVGLDGPLGDLRAKLVFGDEVSMLSVTAPGDSGKTALARMFYHDQLVRKKFNRIFFAKVSINPDLNGLIESLKEFLDQTENNPALLILDDVWPHKSQTLLEELSQFSQGSVYKVLVTSRIMPTYGAHYPLNPLTTDDAIRLLKASSSLRDDQCSHDDYQKCSEQIVKHCNRSPRLITNIGKSLIRDDIEIWKAKVADLIKDPFIPHNETGGLFDSLALSLDGLGEDKEKIKECFIDLASFPEDRRVRASVLIDVWAELYPPDGPHDDALYIAKLQQLNKRNLANLDYPSTEKSDGDGYYSEHTVTQQSKLRKLALYLMRQNKAGETKRLNIDISGDNSQWYAGQKKMMPTEIDLLSITTEGELSSKWYNINLPKCKVLVLNFQTKECALPNFEKEMSKSLKVLIVRNCGSSIVELGNLKKVGSLLPNLKRLRLESLAISSTSVTQKDKKKKKDKVNRSLEKISLYMCNIGVAFSNNSIHFFQAFPNLVEVNIDYCNDLAKLPADLCTLGLLKKLSITNCHKVDALPENIGNLLSLEVLRVRACAGLKRLPNSITSLGKLHTLDLFHCSIIEELPEDIGKISSLRKINMKLCSELKDLPTSVAKLGELEVIICEDEIIEQWKNYLPKFIFPPEIIRENPGLEWLNRAVL